MFSSHRKEARISEPLLCPSCGKEQMISTIENCRLSDGFAVKRLRHYKCQACGDRFFDDEAMHRIQKARKMQNTAAAVGRKVV